MIMLIYPAYLTRVFRDFYVPSTYMYEPAGRTPTVHANASPKLLLNTTDDGQTLQSKLLLCLRVH